MSNEVVALQQALVNQREAIISRLPQHMAAHGDRIIKTVVTAAMIAMTRAAMPTARSRSPLTAASAKVRKNDGLARSINIPASLVATSN